MRLCDLSLAASFALVGCSSSPSTPPADLGVDATVDLAPVVSTEYGEVTGLGDEYEASYYFTAIPYAAPPVGQLRFWPPQAPLPWTTPRPIQGYAPICPQKLPFGSDGLEQGAEDCLYLNVATPMPMPTNAPVVVWLHGGGFVLGSGDQADHATNGKLLASEQGVVVVTVNYRLGQLGFLAHPALTAEQGGHSGNYGMLDQIAALRWVKRNIANFGGDPNRITLHGQSAGGMSVCGLMASPLISDTSVVPAAEQPLFHRAVLESAPCDVPWPSLASAEAQGSTFAQLTGCDDATTPRSNAQVLACLRDPTQLTLALARNTLKPANDFIRPNAAIGEASWGPIVDGYYLPSHPVDRIRAGTFHSVPVVAGFAEDEGDTSMHFHLARSSRPTNGIVRITSSTLYDQEVNKLFAGGIQPSEAQAIYLGASAPAFYRPSTYTAMPLLLTGYTPTDYTPEEQAYARMHGDMDLACPARRTLHALRAAGVSARAYFMRLDGLPFQVTPAFPLGAFHSGDVQLFFGVPAGGALLGMRFDATESQLSDQIRAYHGAFITGGDPNGGTRVTWPLFDLTGRTHLTFDATIATVADPLGTACDLWATVGRDRIGVP